MPEFTVLSVLSVVAVIYDYFLYFRTGIFSTVQFWVAYAIILFFEVLVDGWLTKLTAPIVLYAREHFSGLRFPWDIPVEDYLFGWAMCTLALLLWERQSDPSDRSPEPEPVLDLLRQRSSSLPQ